MNKKIKIALISVFGIAGIANVVTLFITNLTIIRLVGSITMCMLLGINAAMIMHYAESKKVAKNE